MRGTVYISLSVDGYIQARILKSSPPFYNRKFSIESNLSRCIHYYQKSRITAALLQVGNFLHHYNFQNNCCKDK